MNHDQDKNEDTLGSFYMGRMRPPPQPQRVVPKGGLAVVALIAFAAILWYAYPQGQEKYQATDVPVVMADAQAYKFKPDNPGGMDIPHQDSTVFDPLEGRSAAVAERILPGPEEPLAREDVLKAAVPTEAREPKLNLDPQMQEPAAGDPTETVTSDLPKVEKPAAPVVAAEPAKPVQKPAGKPVEKAATAAANGVYIQLGAYRNTAGAQQDWKKLQQKYPKLLNGLTMRTERVDLGAKGVFNRLQAGKVSQAEAESICKTLKSGGFGGCIVIR